MVAKMFLTASSPYDLPPTPKPKTKSARKKCDFINNVDEAGNQRLPTPEKVAILELSDSFEKRRLGKHQQILHDISQRCREQEVSDLSKNLTKKCAANQQKASPRNELSFYNTASTMMPRASKPNKSNVTTTLTEIQNQMSTMPAYDKNRSYFPTRKILRNQKKNDFLNTDPLHSKTKSDCSLSALLRNPRNNSNVTKLNYSTKRNNIMENTKPQTFFENTKEMQNYYFQRSRQIPSLPHIPKEQNSCRQKVQTYLDSLRAYQERSVSGTSGKTNTRNKSDLDSGIYMVTGNQDRGFSPMDPISTRVGSSTFHTYRNTKTSVTSFL